MNKPIQDARLDKWVQQYLWARDTKKRIEDKADAELQEIKEIMESLSGRLQSFLDTHGLQNAKTKFGTVHHNIRYISPLADPEVFMQYVISTGKFDLLDRKANTTAVKAYVQEHNQLPPGVSLSAIKTVGVRKPTKAAPEGITAAVNGDEDGE